MMKVIHSDEPKHLEPFKEKMTSFLENAKTSLNGEVNDLEECQDIFLNTMKFYHFKPKKSTLDKAQPNEFFDMWLSFCEDFKDIWAKELVILSKKK